MKRMRAFSIVVLALAALAGLSGWAAEKKKYQMDDIPKELRQGMVDEPRSLDIVTEEECEIHLLKKKQWEAIRAAGAQAEFVKFKFGYQVLFLAGSPEAVKKIQAAADQLVKDNETLVESTKLTVCRGCAQMKMMGELGNYSMEAAALKKGAMILVMTGIGKLVPELQQYGQEEFDWLDKATRVLAKKP